MRLLLLDIETAPNLGHVWSLWKQNIGLNQLIESGYTLCWAAKWLGEKEMMFGSVQRGLARKMLKPIHKLLDEADAVIHYNGARFDIPTLNKDFITEGMLPPAPFREIDLLHTVERRFRFPSNKLAYVSKALELGEKIDTDHTLWVQCMAGDAKAWGKMELYNRNDVALLERLYLKIRPWIRNHPSCGVFDGISNACQNCGSTRLQARGYAYTTVNTFKKFVCLSCGSWGRAGTSMTSTKERHELIRPVL
jgi:RNase_H superfamily